MGASLGFKIRVMERTGRNILTNFPQTSTWKGMVCGRQECVTCHQGGEDRPDCMRVNLVYENIYIKCNPGALNKGELKEPAEGSPSLYSIYVGETSRSIQERALEHWGAVRRKEELSHMARHQAQEHEGEEPEFIFKVVSHHRTDRLEKQRG